VLIDTEFSAPTSQEVEYEFGDLFRRVVVYHAEPSSEKESSMSLREFFATKDWLAAISVPPPADWYETYLASPYWRQARPRIFAAKGPRCRYCLRTRPQLDPGQYLEIHHWRYDILKDEVRFLDDLVVVCSECHWAADAVRGMIADGIGPIDRKGRDQVTSVLLVDSWIGRV